MKKKLSLTQLTKVQNPEQVKGGQAPAECGDPITYVGGQVNQLCECSTIFMALGMAYG